MFGFPPHVVVSIRLFTVCLFGLFIHPCSVQRNMTSPITVNIKTCLTPPNHTTAADVNIWWDDHDDAASLSAELVETFQTRVFASVGAALSSLLWLCMQWRHVWSWLYVLTARFCGRISFNLTWELLGFSQDAFRAASDVSVWNLDFIRVTK